MRLEGRNVNREEWLANASAALQRRFESSGLAPTGPVRVGVGFTSVGGRGKRIGECWAESASGDSTREVIISPVLDAPRVVLATLLHELVHASLPVDAKHGPAFKRVATACGLEGKMTATTPNPYLSDVLDMTAEDLGEYPHAALSVLLSGKKKDTTRLLKVECAPCEYVVRMSRKALDMGAPMCGVCEERMTEADA